MIKEIEDFVIDILDFKNDEVNQRIRTVLKNYVFYQQFLNDVANGLTFPELNDKEMFRIQRIAEARETRLENKNNYSIDYNDVTIVNL